MELIDTPAAFQSSIVDSQIEVLPLVDEEHENGRAGWCTYTYEHSTAPALEIVSGGVNSKTPEAAGIWRQGHLLHFGFEPSPAELNENGRALLANSICYIAKFKEDRPIVRTPSIFYSRVRILDRQVIGRLVANENRDVQKYLEYYLAPDCLEDVSDLDREGVAKWFEKIGPYLCATSEGKLFVDELAQKWALSPADPSFFETIAAKLSDKDSDEYDAAKALLRRYEPHGENLDHKDSIELSNWWQENRDYMFFSDTGGYRWYVDSLARKRGIPTDELRGPLRATHVEVTEPSQNDPVAIGSAIVPNRARPGDEVTLMIRVKLADGWHVYSDQQQTGVGSPTKFELLFSDDFQPSGPWRLSPPTTHFQDGRHDLVHKNELVVSRKLAISPHAESGSLLFNCNVTYQVCNFELCLPLKTVQLNSTVTILPVSE